MLVVFGFIFGVVSAISSGGSEKSIEQTKADMVGNWNATGAVYANDNSAKISDFSAVLVLDNEGLHWTDPSGTEHIGMWDAAKHYNDKNKKVTMVTLTIPGTPAHTFRGTIEGNTIYLEGQGNNNIMKLTLTKEQPQ